jgi:hypothetical protein
MVELLIVEWMAARDVPNTFGGQMLEGKGQKQGLTRADEVDD